jgi:hypothetical protein
VAPNPGRQRRAIQCSAVAAITFLFAACQASQAQPARDPVTVSKMFVQLYAANRLTANSASPLLADTAKMERVNQYWQIRAASGSTEVVLRAAGRDDPTDDAELRLGSDSGLTLRDLQGAFGNWQLVSSSVTSSVVFHVSGTDGRGVLVFARLPTNSPAAGSPVTSIQLRRDEAVQRGERR